MWVIDPFWVNLCIVDLYIGLWNSYLGTVTFSHYSLEVRTSWGSWVRAGVCFPFSHRFLGLGRCFPVRNTASCSLSPPLLIQPCVSVLVMLLHRGKHDRRSCLPRGTERGGPLLFPQTSLLPPSRNQSLLWSAVTSLFIRLLPQKPQSIDCSRSFEEQPVTESWISHILCFLN